MTIADTTRAATRGSEKPPTLRLTWRACSTSADEATSSTVDFRLHVEIEPCEETDTGTIRSWVERDGGEEELVARTHVDIARILEHGWTHIEVQSEGAPNVSMSLHEGTLRYVRSDYPSLAGLPGGTYDPPTFERLVHDSDEVDE